MAWDSVMLNMLRVFINDFDPTEYLYTDSRLKQILVVSAHYVNQEINLSETYSINIISPNITPDPTETATQDDDFVNFVVLKSACLIDTSTFRQKALLAGLNAKCGPAQLDTSGHLDGFKILLEEGPCKAYELLKHEYNFGYSGGGIIKAIMSPFVSNDFYPTDTNRR